MPFARGPFPIVFRCSPNVFCRFDDPNADAIINEQGEYLDRKEVDTGHKVQAYFQMKNKEGR
jgi:hypothetical protein